MRKTTVSVIIPFYNRSEWLLEAVESVKKQTFGNWELLLVDDGSLPAHTAVGKMLADNNRIFYLDHPMHHNRGVSVSRNLAAANASGLYLAFLDADDYWLPHKLEQQLEIFSRYPSASMICESSLFWHSWEKNPSTDHIVCVGTEPDRLYEPPDLFFQLYPVGTGTPPCPSGIMVTAESFQSVNGFETSFTGRRQLYEDQGLLAKMYLNEKVFVSSACNNMYRKHSGSITETSQHEKTYWGARNYFLRWLQHYVQKNNIAYPGITEKITEIIGRGNLGFAEADDNFF